MSSAVDSSVLNSRTIKQFTRAVLERHGGDIEDGSDSRWAVTFPGEVANSLDRTQATLVFDPDDQTDTPGELLVQPGTRVFSALLELVHTDASFGRLRLTPDTLQVNLPATLTDAELSVTVDSFSEDSLKQALAFHFRVTFETPASFHSEEMCTVTVDPASDSLLPRVGERVLAHLPQLLHEHEGHTGYSISQSQLDQAFDRAQQAVIERCRPIATELQAEANESTNERVDELGSWAKQRLAELDEQLADQRETVAKWEEKRQNARKESTRKRYRDKRVEAKRELKTLKKTVEKQKHEIRKKARQERETVRERNAVDVDISLLGVTELEFAQGTLELALANDHVETTYEVEYCPATDDLEAIRCAVCVSDLSTDSIPRLCVCGRVVGECCVSTCRSCGGRYCVQCVERTDFGECDICLEGVCEACLQRCSVCESTICAEHAEECQACQSATCQRCGAACTTCETFHCDDHLGECSDCGDYHCVTHSHPCAICGQATCDAHTGTCSACGNAACTSHRHRCLECDDLLCSDDIAFCSACSTNTTRTGRGFCTAHDVTCGICGTTVCGDHRVSRKLEDGYLCSEHSAACDSCGVRYSTEALQESQCSACRSVGEVPAEAIPGAIRSEFRSVKAGRNDAYMVIIGSKLIGRNKLLVYDRRAEREIDRQNAGMFQELFNAFE